MKAKDTRMGKLLLSEDSIYGLILVAGMIIIGRSSTGSSLEALITVTITMVVFFAGHVYAATIATLGHTNNELSTWRSLLRALKNSSGMILVSLVPIGMLALGVSDLVDDDIAVWLALIVDAALLAAVGWLITSRNTQKFWLRFYGALMTASLGVALIALKAFFYN